MGHFRILLYEEIIFQLHKGKKLWTEVKDHHYFPRAVEIAFLHTKGCGDAIPIRNERISPCNFQ